MDVRASCDVEVAPPHASNCSDRIYIRAICRLLESQYLRFAHLVLFAPTLRLASLIEHCSLIIMQVTNDGKPWSKRDELLAIWAYSLGLKPESYLERRIEPVNRRSTQGIQNKLTFLKRAYFDNRENPHQTIIDSIARMGNDASLFVLAPDEIQMIDQGNYQDYFNKLVCLQTHFPSHTNSQQYHDEYYARWINFLIPLKTDY